MTGLVALTLNLWQKNDTVLVNTKSFLDIIKPTAPHFCDLKQNDAQEFWRYLVQNLHEDTNKADDDPPIFPELPFYEP